MERLNYYLKSPGSALKPLGKITKTEAQSIAEQWTKKYNKKYTIV